ncbi:hypothetical protein K7432_017934 [Basidiobolus ranarum]|uniref:ATP synthase F0 subunit 8 n=1 Tax=Basidiobolus ranarum TaxID=34480 RepID=A0ABR2VJP3_9FUNG
MAIIYIFQNEDSVCEGLSDNTEMEEYTKNQYLFLVQWIVYGILLGLSYYTFCRKSKRRISQVESGESKYIQLTSSSSTKDLPLPELKQVSDI